MSDKPPTPKEWQRRALKAEAELESIKKIRQFENDRELEFHRKQAVMHVVLNEIADALEFYRGNAT